MKRHFVGTWSTLGVAIAGMLGTAQLASAQILYVNFSNDGAANTLREMDTAGATDVQVPLQQFSSLAYPAWSRDTAQFAITGRVGSQFSLNTYTIDKTTGAMQQITSFQDSNDGQNHSFGWGLFKAFSPDRSRLAVHSVYINGGANTPDNYVPILEVYRNDGFKEATVFPGRARDGLHHAGEGVDWSPTQNLLAAPEEVDTPLKSGGGSAETTAIFLFLPDNSGNLAQLTSPEADQAVDPFNGYVYDDHDYQPKFSPDGRNVAYVRSRAVARTSTGGAPDPDIQSLRIINVETRADAQVINFKQGLYVTSVDWSPDGSQLIFDIGQQAYNSGFPQTVTLSTDEIHIVDLNGSNEHTIRGAGGGQPAWEPNAPASTPTPSPTPTPDTTATPATTATPGTTPSPTANPSATPDASPTPGNQPPALGNISTRLAVETDDNVLIGGFIITGNQPKKLIVRAIGPSLPVAGHLTNPNLELYNSSSLVATNDNWVDAPNKQEIIDSTVAPTNDFESAILTSLDPGSYTAIVRGANGTTGIGLVEVYDLDPSADSKLANISTRGFVQTGDNVMIGGLYVVGSASQKVIVRALGPSLPVTGKLTDPMLELRDGNGGLLASNNNWRSDQESEIIATTVSPHDDAESAIVRILAPGPYTAIVRGVNGATGVALVEVYALQ